jgi:hypothetical protein
VIPKTVDIKSAKVKSKQFWEQPNYLIRTSTVDIEMNRVQTYLTISMSLTALIVAGNIIPTGNAQSSSTQNQKSICPLNQSPIGLICVPPPPVYILPTGKWSIYINGFSGILNISSVDKTGKVQGTMYGVSSNSSITLLCTVVHPCKIDGSFDGKTGRINFTSTPTVETFVPTHQNYMGYLSEKVELDIKFYTLVGVGRSYSPDPGPFFGWYAIKSCLVTGCIE